MARSARKPERETDEICQTGFNKAGQNDHDAPCGCSGGHCRGSRERHLIETRH